MFDLHAVYRDDDGHIIARIRLWGTDIDTIMMRAIRSMRIYATASTVRLEKRRGKSFVPC